MSLSQSLPSEEGPAACGTLDLRLIFAAALKEGRLHSDVMHAGVELQRSWETRCWSCSDRGAGMGVVNLVAKPRFLGRIATTSQELNSGQGERVTVFSGNVKLTA